MYCTHQISSFTTKPAPFGSFLPTNYKRGLGHIKESNNLMKPAMCHLQYKYRVYRIDTSVDHGSGVKNAVGAVVRCMQDDIGPC